MSYDWAHEVTLFHTVYDGTLRVMDEAKGMWRDVDSVGRRGSLGERRPERGQLRMMSRVVFETAVWYSL
jgi:hypothetical protein